MVLTEPPSTYSATGKVNEQIDGYFSATPHAMGASLDHVVRPSPVAR